MTPLEGSEENQQPKLTDVPEEVQTSLSPRVDDDKAGPLALFIGDETASQRYLEAVRAFRKQIPKATKPTDWVSFGDPTDPAKCQTHLQEYAASQLSRMLQTMFGYTLRIKMPEPVTFPGSTVPFGIERTVMDKEGKNPTAHLEYIVSGSVEITDNNTGLTEVVGPILGSASTENPLFTKRHGEFLDPKTVPFAQLMKLAVANYKGNVYREVWGLKGFTLADLAACGIDIKQVHDSKRRAAGAGATDQEKQKRDELWKRILRVHDDKPDLARAFLKSLTSYPGKPGSYEANPGFEDINRLYFTTKDGKTESVAYRKVKEAIEKMEKSQGVQPEPTNEKAVDEEPAAPAAEPAAAPAYNGQVGGLAATASSQEAYTYYSTLISKANTVQSVRTIETVMVGSDARLSIPQIKSLRSQASRKVDELDGKKG